MSDPGEISVAQLIDALPDAILVVAPDGMIMLTNVQAEWLLGCSRGHIMGESLNAFLPARFHAKHDEYFKDYLAQPVTRRMGAAGGLIVQQSTGREVAVDISLGPLMTPSGLFVIATIRRKAKLPAPLVGLTRP